MDATAKSDPDFGPNQIAVNILIGTMQLIKVPNATKLVADGVFGIEARHALNHLHTEAHDNQRVPFMAQVNLLDDIMNNDGDGRRGFLPGEWEQKHTDFINQLAREATREAD